MRYWSRVVDPQDRLAGGADLPQKINLDFRCPVGSHAINWPPKVRLGNGRRKGVANPCCRRFREIRARIEVLRRERERAEAAEAGLVSDCPSRAASELIR
jgi:hypothetical protein